MTKHYLKKAVNEALSIIQHSKVIELNKTHRKFYNPSIDEIFKTGNFLNAFDSKLGYCLRCEKRIPFNSDQALLRFLLCKLGILGEPNI